MKTLGLVLLLFAGAAAQVPWDTAAPLPFPRYSASTVSAGDIGYVLGGSVTGAVKTATMLVYHQQGDSWSVGDSMLVARHRFGACGTAEKLYVFGGWGSGGVLLNRGESYDVGSRTWAPIETMKVKRASLAGAMVNGKLYALGGWTGTVSLAAVEEYDPATGHWTTKRPMTAARCEMMVGVWNNLIYLIGGTTNGSDVLNKVEAYDPVRDTWYVRAPIPTPRTAAGCGAVGGKICVFGGVTTGGVNTRATEVYWPATNQWLATESLPSSRRFIAGFGLYYDRVYAIGGADSIMQAMTLVEYLDLPMGLSAEPGASIEPAARTFFRRGELVRSPFGEQRFSARVYDCAGVLQGKLMGTGALLCPPLASGVYLVSWQAGAAETVTRLMVLAD